MHEVWPKRKCDPRTVGAFLILLSFEHLTPSEAEGERRGKVVSTSSPSQDHRRARLPRRLLGGDASSFAFGARIHQRSPARWLGSTMIYLWLGYLSLACALVRGALCLWVVGAGGHHPGVKQRRPSGLSKSSMSTSLRELSPLLEAHHLNIHIT